MPKCVVDGLKIVQINEHQRVELIIVHACGNSQPYALGKQGPIGKAGELIIKGKLVDSGLIAAAFIFPGKIVQGKAEICGHFAKQFTHFCIKSTHFHGIEGKVAHYLAPLP